MVPGFFVISDSLSFSCRDVKSARTGDPLDEATLTYSLIDSETRVEITSGEMTPYSDPGKASFEAVIDPSELAPYDSESNPGGVIPNREYLLRAVVDNDGVTTTKVARLRAMLDPPDNAT